MENKMTFKEFCAEYLDNVYTYGIPEEEQCTGYLELKKMIVEGIEPASIEEILRWQNNPTDKELFEIPDIKYLKFLHPLLRNYVISYWNIIKNLEI